MSLSIVIPVINQEDALRTQLPELLQQEGVDDVVVVNMDSEDNTKEFLESLELFYPHLHHTYTPHSAHNIDLRSLAAMLGVRAAKHNLVLLTYIDERCGNPLLSLPVATLEAKAMAFFKKKKNDAYFVLLRPHCSFFSSMRWHVRKGGEHFYKYFISKRSGISASNYQIILKKPNI